MIVMETFCEPLHNVPGAFLDTGQSSSTLFEKCKINASASLMVQIEKRCVRMVIFLLMMT